MTELVPPSPEQQDEAENFIIESPGRPYNVALEWVSARWMSRDLDCILMYHRDEWLKWEDGIWIPIDKKEIRAELWSWLSVRRYVHINAREDPPLPEEREWNPTTSRVNNVMDALESIVMLPEEWPEDGWLPAASEDDRASTAGKLVIPTESGLIVLPAPWLGPAGATLTSLGASLKPASRPVKVLVDDLRTNLTNLSSITPIFYNRRLIRGSREQDTKKVGLAGSSQDQNGHLPGKTAGKMPGPTYPGGWSQGGPDEWLKFIGELWPGNESSQNLLQEWFGYLISAETRAQKALLVIGPTRSGKGTICAVIKALCGERTCVSTSLSSLTERFGLQNFLGKSIAIISDAEFRSYGKDVAVAVERLKAITGCDDVEVDRKNKQAWTGKLKTRFTVMANKTPKLADDSAALANRFLTLRLTESWLDREDFQLQDRLLIELPEILVWALEGLYRLDSNGWRFSQGDAGIAEELELLGAPVKAFAQECCHRNEKSEENLVWLFTAYQRWCYLNGLSPNYRDVFSKELTAAYPGLKRVRKKLPDGRRETWIAGIRLSVEL